MFRTEHAREAPGSNFESFLDTAYLQGKTCTFHTKTEKCAENSQTLITSFIAGAGVVVLALSRDLRVYEWNDVLIRFALFACRLALFCYHTLSVNSETRDTREQSSAKTIFDSPGLFNCQ